jgi:hypothetical protein
LFVANREQTLAFNKKKNGKKNSRWNFEFIIYCFHRFYKIAQKLAYNSERERVKKEMQK